ncbi:hypothetical protein LG293_16955 (plasmid) [Citricoccus nitrophenolicus]
MLTAGRPVQHPYPQSLAKDVAQAIWIQGAVDEGSTRQWAEEAWEDMGGSEPADERALLEVKVAESLRSAPHYDRLGDLVADVTARLG